MNPLVRPTLTGCQNRPTYIGLLQIFFAGDVDLFGSAYAIEYAEIGPVAGNPILHLAPRALIFMDCCSVRVHVNSNLPTLHCRLLTQIHKKDGALSVLVVFPKQDGYFKMPGLAAGSLYFLRWVYNMWL